MTSIDLATVRLRSGALDAAVSAIEPALSLPSARRVNALMTRLQLVRTELAAPVFRGSARPRDLDERIEEFGRDSVTAGPARLALGPGLTLPTGSGPLNRRSRAHVRDDQDSSPGGPSVLRGDGGVDA
jgi:hypothetical protein